MKADRLQVTTRRVVRVATVKLESDIVRHTTCCETRSPPPASSFCLLHVFDKVFTAVSLFASMQLKSGDWRKSVHSLKSAGGRTKVRRRPRDVDLGCGGDSILLPVTQGGLLIELLLYSSLFARNGSI